MIWRNAAMKRFALWFLILSMFLGWMLPAGAEEILILEEETSEILLESEEMEEEIPVEAEAERFEYGYVLLTDGARLYDAPGGEVVGTAGPYAYVWAENVSHAANPMGDWLELHYDDGELGGTLYARRGGVTPISDEAVPEGLFGGCAYAGMSLPRMTVNPLPADVLIIGEETLMEESAEDAGSWEDDPEEDGDSVEIFDLEGLPEEMILALGEEPEEEEIKPLYVYVNPGPKELKTEVTHLYDGSNIILSCPDQGTKYEWFKNSTEGEPIATGSALQLSGCTDAEYILRLDGTQLYATHVTIEKRQITFTSATVSKTYDGTELKDDGVEITGDGFADREGVTFTVTGSQTAAGKSDNTFTYTANPGTNLDNYEITEKKGALEVKKRSVTFSSESASKTYDGDTLTADTITIGGEGFVEGDGVTFTVTGNQTAAGKSGNTFTYQPKQGTDLAN